MVEDDEESCTSETFVELLVKCETPCTRVPVLLLYPSLLPF